jgi:NitT/TauT family transport system substrate-binding protein
MMRFSFCFLAALAALTLVGCPSATTNPDTKASADGSKSAAKKDELAVGFLPVTCHLTCPVTDFASHTTSTGTTFKSERFTDWPTVAEALKSGALKATFMIAPLAMKLKEQGVACHILYLGHRDGSTVMVRKEDPAKSLTDLKGKTFAIPSKASNQYLVIRKLMEDQKVAENEIKFIELAPPDMAAALASKEIDAYFVGEPHAAKAELDGTGRVLYNAKDIWPQFISCVLVVRDDYAKEKPEVVRDLVRGIAESGEWAESHRSEAARVAAPMFKQKEKLLDYVLKQPGRVSYVNLNPSDADIQQIIAMAVKTGVIKKSMAVSDILDRQFIPKDIKAANIPIESIPAAKP